MTFLHFFLLLFSFGSAQVTYYLPPPVGATNGFFPGSWDTHSYPVPDESNPLITTWVYSRALNISLKYLPPLADFTRIQFLMSTEYLPARIRMNLTDIDGAIFETFIDLVTVNPDVWVTVDLTPSSFDLSPSSPVIKASLDSSDLRHGMMFFDEETEMSPDGMWNIVRITPLIVDYSPFDTVLPSINVGIGEVLTLQDESVAVVGSVTVLGRLVIRDVSRFYLLGDTEITGGEIVFDRSLFIAPQVYFYQFTIDMIHGAKLTLTDSTMSLFQPFGLNLFNGSTYDATNFDVTSGMQTMGLGQEFPQWSIAGSNLFLDNVHHFGEVIVQQGSVLTARGCTGTLLIWHWLPSGVDVGTLVFPEPDADYTGVPALPYSITVTEASEASETSYALLAATGCSAVVDRSTIRTIGLYFEGDAVVDGIRNGQTFDDYQVGYGMDLLLTGGTSVHTFSFYTNRFDDSTPEFALDLRNSLFGEALASGSSKMVIRDSECDGSGGYVGTNTDSEMTVWYTEINTRVIARDSSVVRLYGCTVNGQVVAESGTIYVNGTTINGDVLEILGGRVIYGELVDPESEVTDPTRRTTAIVVGAVLGSLGTIGLVLLLVAVIVCALCLKTQKQDVNVGLSDELVHERTEDEKRA